MANLNDLQELFNDILLLQRLFLFV